MQCTVECNQHYNGSKRQAGFLCHLFGVPDLPLEAQMRPSTRLPGSPTHAQREAISTSALSLLSRRGPLALDPLAQAGFPHLPSTAAGKVVRAVTLRWHRPSRSGV